MREFGSKDAGLLNYTVLIKTPPRSARRDSPKEKEFIVLRNWLIY